MKRRVYSVLVVSLILTSSVWADSLSICSFNIQFLGNSKERDDEALAGTLKDFDIVVVQELCAPPYPGRFPNGEAFKPDPEAAEFFKAMKTYGFVYALSEEDTGTGDKIHSNGSSTEWWVAFYRSNRVSVVTDLPSGYLAEDRSNHPDFERVPFAFGFRTSDRHLDFVLISVHLMPGSGKASRDRRHHELSAIAKWIEDARKRSPERDFIILGDMNIENAGELQQATPGGFLSLNDECRPTNTNVRDPKPYDHVMYSIRDTDLEMDREFDLRVLDLIKAMREPWRQRFRGKYPGDTPYNHDQFRKYYSDHHPVVFRMITPDTDDDR